MRQTLIVFAKTPRIGLTKSRLAAGIGAPRATAFYRDNVARLLRGPARDPRWHTILALAPDHRATPDPRWPPLPAEPQGSGDIGRRMDRVMRRQPPGPVVLVGGDVPGIRHETLAHAFRLLGRHDLVFGPAADGGFWLVGARRRPRFPRVMDQVRWSTAHALDDIRHAAAGLDTAFVEMLEDVDDAEAWARWRARINSRDRSSAPGAGA